MDEVRRLEQCQCAPDQCAKGVNPPFLCVARIEGGVHADLCPACEGQTWHTVNNECVPCLRGQADLRGSQEVRQDAVNVPNVGSTPTPAASSPTGVTVTVDTKYGKITAPVRDRALATRIIKQILKEVTE